LDIREMVAALDVEPGLVHETDHWRVFCEYVDHGHGLGMSIEEWPCMGYRLEAEGKRIVISGDAVNSGNLLRLSQGADVLIMCCYLAGAEINHPDLKLFSEQVLASSRTAGKIAASAAVKKLVLHHIKEKPAELLEAMVEEIRRDFNGPVLVGRDLLELSV
jgi:ribonuclease Z